MISDSVDTLGYSGILRKARITREEFDPLVNEHLDSLRLFLDTGNWGTVQFYPEAPYTTVPETVFRKIAHAALVASGRPWMPRQ
jgi:hypothetical protein